MTALNYLNIFAKSKGVKEGRIVEWKDFDGDLAEPFLYQKDGKIYHGFGSGKYYIWKDKSVKLIK